MVLKLSWNRLVLIK